MSKIADRLLNRLVPKRTAWACRVEICNSTPWGDCYCCRTPSGCSCSC